MQRSSSSILLVAVNARYGHCALAARSLLANLGEHRAQAAILETDLDVQPFQLAAEIAGRAPAVAGFSVYLWNTQVVRDTLAILRRVAPGMHLVLGGPEIVAGCAAAWAGLADVLVAGEGEGAFRRLCDEILGDPRATAPGRAPPRMVLATPEDPATLQLPYDLYTEHDIAHRTIFAESSRGCPFACAYCSSGGTGLRRLPLPRLLPELQRLLERGVRAFRFLDRSLNLCDEHACELLDFFLARHPARLNLHFEIMPCRLPPPLRQRLAAFPPGVLHLEVGVQTLNESVARAIGRHVENAVLFETLGFLARETQAAVHADLIFGLPGEDLASFAEGFDRMVRRFDFPELQVNLLKRLPGTLLASDPRYAGLVFNPASPYELLASDCLGFAEIARLQQVARCWELVHNRGRFPRAAARVWQAGDASPFQRYQALAARIQEAEGRLHALGHARLAGHLEQFLQDVAGLSAAEARAAVS